MEENLTRYQILTSRESMASPACCFFTRKADEDWYLWTGTFTEFEGAIYIGETAFNDMANVLGFAAPERFKRLLKAYKQLKEENDALRSRDSRISGATASIRAMLEELEGDGGPTTTGNHKVQRSGIRDEQGTSEDNSESNQLERRLFEAARGASNGPDQSTSVS